MKITRRAFLKGIGGLAAGTCLTGAAGAGGLQYATRAEINWLETEQIQIPVKNLAASLEGLKIIHLSDIHFDAFTKKEFIQQIVDTANALKPDLVALTGDFVTKEFGRGNDAQRLHKAVFELAAILTNLNPKFGVFAVFGNHDLAAGDSVIRQGLEENGITVLCNEGLTLSAGSGEIYIAGVDDGWLGRPDLTEAMRRHPGNIPTILLAHEPDLADEFAADERVTLQLSGHSHGGQVRLPGIGALVLPYLAQKYPIGLNRAKDLWVYTTRGIGTSGLPVRVNCRPELTEITLVGESSVSLVS